jgi:hypothetical protein
LAASLDNHTEGENAAGGGVISPPSTAKTPASSKQGEREVHTMIVPDNVERATDRDHIE